MIRIHNTEIDEVIDREMTDNEYNAWLDRKAIDDAKAEAQAKTEAAKAAAQEKHNSWHSIEDSVPT